MYTTWNVNKIVDGRVTNVGNLGTSGAASGTTIAVHTKGDRITVALNGILRRRFTDPDLRDASGVGLAARLEGTQPGELLPVRGVRRDDQIVARRDRVPHPRPRGCGVPFSQAGFHSRAGQGMRKTFLAFVVVVALVAGVSTTAGAVNRGKVRKPGPTRVLLMGDSITASYSARVAELLGPTYQVTGAGVGGTGLLDQGICEGIRAQNLVNAYDPDVVVVEYTGNYVTGRTQGPPGCTPVVEWGSKTWLRQWKTAEKVNFKILRKRGARVIGALVPLPAIPLFATLAPKLNTITSAVARSGDTLDAWTAFGGSTYNVSLHNVDQLHLSPAGVEVFANLIRDKVLASPAP